MSTIFIYAFYAAFILASVFGAIDLYKELKKRK